LEEKDARLKLIAVTHMKQEVYSNFFKLRIISTFKSKKVENKWLLSFLLSGKPPRFQVPPPFFPHAGTGIGGLYVFHMIFSWQLLL